MILCNIDNFISISISRAQRIPTNQDDDHAKYPSPKARVSTLAECAC